MKRHYFYIAILLITACHSPREITYSNIAGTYDRYGFGNNKILSGYSVRLDADSTFSIDWINTSSQGRWKIVNDTIVLKSYRPTSIVRILTSFEQCLFKYKVLKGSRLKYIPVDIQADVLKRQDEQPISKKEMSYITIQGIYTGESTVGNLTYNYVLQLTSTDSTFCLKECIADYKISCEGKFVILENSIYLTPYEFPVPAECYDNDEMIRFCQPRRFKILDTMHLKYMPNKFPRVLKRKK